MNGPPHRAPVASDAPRLSIVLATLNERDNLPAVVERIRRQPLPPFELVVVDDGSTDGTREYLRQAATQDPRILPLFHEGKQTTLRAQCQGIERASGQYVVVMDADLQHPPELLPSLVRRLDVGDGLVIASRYAPGGSAGPRTPSRWLISHGAEAAAKLLLPAARGISDPVSGYFAFRRAIWSPLNEQYRGYKLLLFVLVMAAGQAVGEVGFRFEPRGEGASKVTQSSAFIRLFLVELLLARRLSVARRNRPGPGS